MLYVREAPPPPARKSPALRVEREFVKDILSLSADRQPNAFKAVSYPMPDGSYRDLVFRSFVTFRPEALALTESAKSKNVAGKLQPRVQWLARVGGTDTRPEEAVSLGVAGGKMSGQASFGGRHYAHDLDRGTLTDSVTYALLEDDVRARPKVGKLADVRRRTRFFHRETLIARLALVVDYSLAQELGSVEAAINAMLDLVADLNTIYFRDLEVVFKVTYLGIMNVGPSPYETPTRFGGTDIQATTMEAFENDWNSNYGKVERDLVVLATRNLVISARTGVAEGLSNLDSLCDRDKAYVLFTYSSDPAIRLYRAGHEIGHCFGAIHTHCTPDPDSPIGFVDGCHVAAAAPGEPPPPCFAGPDPVYPNVPGTLMSVCPTVTPRFHALSAAMIEQKVTTKTCLEPASLKLLQSGVPEGNLSSLFGSTLYFAIDVPQDVADFRVETTGGTGDADVHVQRRTLNVYASWPSANPGNNEAVVLPLPVKAGRYYIRLEPAPAPGDFADVQLTATYLDALTLQDNAPRTELQMPAGTALYFKRNIPPGPGAVTLTATSPSGQFVLVVGLNQRPDVRREGAQENLAYDDGGSATKMHATAQGQATVGVWYVGILALADLPELTVTIAQ